jgi:ATP adenylyltransferase/5',5'''-P-1,P-4-tetraphosphate phosphorylase II
MLSFKTVIFMSNLNSQIKSLFQEQISNWELARNNYAGLKTVKTKMFGFDNFEVLVQFNPARIVSSGAKMDAKAIAERPCFLCVENLPVEQKKIDAGDYYILVNPFPIFPEHFTIPYKTHVPQQIKPYFEDLLFLSRQLNEFVVFYNGPRCGASAPDHLHFQAGTKDFLPLINDYKRLRNTNVDLVVNDDEFRLFSMKDYLRTVICIEAKEISANTNVFNELYRNFQEQNDQEPMMNIVVSFENETWFTFIFLRKAFRPEQYTAPEDKQLLISPAAVEMSGIFITPVESHFERITKEDIESIFSQISKGS